MVLKLTGDPQVDKVVDNSSRVCEHNPVPLIARIDRTRIN